MLYQAVRSSMIQRVAYDSDSHVLRVVFSSGREYWYFAVPKRVYWEMTAAESVGQYFNEHVKGVYPSQRVRKPG